MGTHIIITVLAAHTCRITQSMLHYTQNAGFDPVCTSKYYFDNANMADSAEICLKNQEHINMMKTRLKCQ